MPLIAYIAFAYDLTMAQFLQLQSQLPKWATSEGFDIEARADGNPTREKMRLMMRSLLADRFKLAVHTDAKEGPVYALVLAKPGKTGPQLRPDAEPCSIEPTAPPSQPVPQTTPTQFPTVCGFSMMKASAPGRFRAGGRGVSIKLITMYLTGPLTGLDRPVVDKTGLTGVVDFTIEFTPPSAPGAGFQADADGPTFLQALQEQLGLKVESTTGPVDVLVIDHVEEPSPN